MSGQRGRLVLKEGAPGSARHLARHIRRMALLVRGAALAPAPKAWLQQGGAPDRGPEDAEDGPETAGHRPGWWVLAQGGPIDGKDFAEREAAREELLARVRRAGILVGENVWVWDLSGRAQLVLTTLPSLERARKVAQRLRAKGLAIVVRREMGEAAGRR